MTNLTNATGVLEIVKQNSVIERFLELISAPYFHKEMLWIVLPLVIGLIIMQVYFGRYKKEELGWNTAVGNSLALIFVSVDLVRQIFTNSTGTVAEIFLGEFGRVMVVIILAFVSMWLLFGEFFHFLPKKFAFIISSSIPTSLAAYIAITLIYTNTPTDFTTFIAALLLLVVLVAVFKIIHFLEPISLKG